MNLPSSIFVTGLIVAIVWLGVVFQPGQAVAYNMDDLGSMDEGLNLIEAASDVARKQLAMNEVISPVKAVPAQNRQVSVDNLVGITQDISLKHIDSLWGAFTNNAELHERVKFDKGSIYVLYRELNAGFDHARVTIGYDSGDVKGENKWVSVPQGEFEVLLDMGKHSASSLLNAWNGLDYSRQVEALVERHVIGDAGDVTSAGLYVLYR